MVVVASIATVPSVQTQVGQASVVGTVGQSGMVTWGHVTGMEVSGSESFRCG